MCGPWRSRDQLGPILGSFVIIFFGESVRFLPIPMYFSRFVAPIQGMIYGTVLILIMLRRPEDFYLNTKGDNAEN